MGRKEKTKNQYEDRIIDLDILIYNNITINSAKLSLPHPKIRMRKFSLLILKDLYNYKLIPGLNNTADEMLKRNKDYSKIEVVEK
jgi:2-amino-4-hydroxy-6-hydroxymethyldihydropteridine diphosphokinase